MSNKHFHKELRFNECIDSSLDLNEMLKITLINVFESLVPFTDVLCFEGTIGVTVDRKRTLLIHFSNAVNKNITSTERRNNQQPERNFDGSFCPSTLEENFPLHQMEKTKPSANDLKQSLLQTLLHQSKKTYCSDEGNSVPRQNDCSFGISRVATFSTGKSTSHRRTGQPPKNTSERTAGPALRTLSNYQTPNGNEVDQDSTWEQDMRQFYVNIEPDECRDANFSIREKSEPLNERDDDPVLQLSPENDDSEKQMESTDGHDRTLLRQLLQPKKMNKSKPQKRKSIDSEEYLPPSYRKDRFPATSLHKNRRTVLFSSDISSEQESSRISSLRSNSLKTVVADVPRIEPVEDDIGSGKRSTDSILCRLLTSGVSMYDATEVEHLRTTSPRSSKDSMGHRVEFMDDHGSSPRPAKNIAFSNIKQEKDSTGRVFAVDEASEVDGEPGISGRDDPTTSLDSSKFQSGRKDILLLQNNVVSAGATETTLRQQTTERHAAVVAVTPEFEYIKPDPDELRDSIELSNASNLKFKNM